MKKYITILTLCLGLSALAMPTPCFYDAESNNNLWLESPTYLASINYNPYLYTDISYPFLDAATPSPRQQVYRWFSYQYFRWHSRVPCQTVPDAGSTTLPLLGAGLFGLFLIHRVTQKPAPR